MGQASARGTREERARQALERDRLRYEQEKAQQAAQAESERAAVAKMGEAERIAYLDEARRSHMRRLRLNLLMASMVGISAAKFR